jgi:hypothetical protein
MPCPFVIYIDTRFCVVVPEADEFLAMADIGINAAFMAVE